MGAYGIGVFVLGTFCSYLIQRYRRNHVCQYSILAVALCVAAQYYLDFIVNVKMEFWALVLSRFAQGAFLGLAEMTLASTLIIDTCESFQRTEANYTASWFARFALSLGPVASILVFQVFDYQGVLIASFQGTFRHDVEVQPRSFLLATRYLALCQLGNDYVCCRYVVLPT